MPKLTAYLKQPKTNRNERNELQMCVIIWGNLSQN